MNPIGTIQEGTPPTRKEFETMFGVVIGIAIVCGLGFITLVMQSFYESAASNNALREKIILQESKIDNLEKELQKINTTLQGAKFIYISK